jgi:hypothetical protein
MSKGLALQCTSVATVILLQISKMMCESTKMVAVTKSRSKDGNSILVLTFAEKVTKACIFSQILISKCPLIANKIQINGRVTCRNSEQKCHL